MKGRERERDRVAREQLISGFMALAVLTALDSVGQRLRGRKRRKRRAGGIP